jgi:hypothetical protein
LAEMNEFGMNEVLILQLKGFCGIQIGNSVLKAIKGPLRSCSR